MAQGVFFSDKTKRARALVASASVPVFISFVQGVSRYQETPCSAKLLLSQQNSKVHQLNEYVRKRKELYYNVFAQLQPLGFYFPPRVLRFYLNIWGIFKAALAQAF